MKTIFVAIVSILVISFSAEARRSEGFFEIKEVQEFSEETKATLQNSIFKIQIGNIKDMHGTAFLISSDGLMLTNVHNVKSCLDTHGLATSGYDGKMGDLDCSKLSLKDSEDRPLGEIKLVASYPYTVASGHRTEVAVVRSNAPEVLTQLPLRLSQASKPNEEVFNIGYAGKTNRSVRKIAKQIRNLSSVIRHFITLDNEVAVLDPIQLPTVDILASFFNTLQKSTPHLADSNFLSGVILPSDLSTWMGLKPGDAKDRIFAFSKRAQLQMYAYLKMLESLKLTQYRRGYLKSYPDADNTLKSSRATTASERWPGVWILRGDARPGSSGSPIVDTNGEVNGIVFAASLIAIDVRNGCTLDVMFSDWESENYASCRNVGFLAVDSNLILRSLKAWGIVLR